MKRFTIAFLLLAGDTGACYQKPAKADINKALVARLEEELRQVPQQRRSA